MALGGSVLGVELMPSIVFGAALTATSIGIYARVLSDLGRLRTPEGQVVIGAAVVDDVVGLIILSIVGSLIAGAEASVGAIARTALPAIGLVVVALALGSVAMPPLVRLVERVRTTGTLGIIALGFALLLAWLAVRSESAMIIGAFAAGLLLHPTPHGKEIERSATQLGNLFVPIFFKSVGASVDFGALMLTVVVTTFLTPPLLRLIVALRTPDAEAAPDQSGIDDLVIGSNRRAGR